MGLVRRTPKPGFGAAHHCSCGRRRTAAINASIWPAPGTMSDKQSGPRTLTNLTAILASYPSATVPATMKHPALPENEADRLEVLERLQIVHTPAEERFDRITRLASRLLNAPIALVSLVAEDKQWFKSRQGLNAIETGREISFCGHAILNEDIYVIPNALKDPDFRDNPLVTGPPNIRFYAGQPLHFEQMRIGTLCVIDTKPRHMRPADYDSLKSLGYLLELEINAWHQERNSFLQKLLRHERNENLIDPLTGNFNETGLLQARKIIAEQSLNACRLNLELEYSESSEEEQELLHSKIAATLRSVVGDRGIIGLTDSKCFEVILLEQDAATNNLIHADLRARFTELKESGAIESTWTWQLSEV